MSIHKDLHHRDDVVILYVSRKRALKITSIHRYNDPRNTQKKAQRKTYYCDQKQYKQRKDQQNRK